MKLKLMISALMLCSSLSLAGDLTTAPTSQKKKAPRVTTTVSSTSGSDTSVLGTVGTGTGTGSVAPKPKKAMPLRGTSTAAEK